MLDHRRSLMEDYQLSPSVVRACENDISKFCNEKLEGNGRTIHCLMEHARPTTRKKKRITEECKREVSGSRVWYFSFLHFLSHLTPEQLMFLFKTL